MFFKPTPDHKSVFLSEILVMDAFFVCRVAVAPLRAEPSDKSEMVSQLLFGDRVKLLEQTENWWRIKNKYDDYLGWMDFKQLLPISQDAYFADEAHQFVVPANFNNILLDDSGQSLHINPGSTLPFYKDGFCLLGDKKFLVKFEALYPALANLDMQVLGFANLFLNAPYLWGGRNLMGIDCSGFTQIVFKMLGIRLPRDAYQQAQQGVLVNFLTESKIGDLAFFDNADGKITHVGIMLGNDKIIHASGRVRIDGVDNQGIYNQELTKYTHKLRIVKRLG